MKEDRRAFLESLAALPLASSTLVAPPVPPASSPAEGTDLEAVAEALAGAAEREFRPHLDASELRAVRKEILAGLERARRLRKAARLANADPPVVRFEAAPAEAKGVRR